jgi:mono/diheme cytochrome c family protein
VSIANGTLRRESRRVALLLCVAGNLAWAFQAPAGNSPIFERDVLPVLKANTCLGCHGSSLKIKDLNLSTFEGVRKGSETGAVVVPGKPDESLLFQMVHDGKMPPGGKIRLSDADLAAIRSWIEGGAKSESQPAEAAEAVTQDDIIPILYLRCTPCHGLRRQEAGLDLRTKAAILKGGKSGPAIVPGKPGESLIVSKIKAGDMPPKKLLLEAKVKPVAPAELDKIARWIAEGAPEVAEPADLASTDQDPLVSAKDRQWWAFHPPQAFAAPPVHHADRVRNPIDAFVLAKLEAKGLGFSAEGGKLTLIRRATFDLTGMPPEPADVKAFLADQSPDAYEKLIDRLLASPRYGEHWARYWLDAAGYADSEGGKMTTDDPRPLAWRYRDYVIRSLNADKPYDRFLLEQIAGDELADYEHAPKITQELMDNLIATGFLRMAQDSTNEGPVDYVDDRLDVISDELDVFGSTVLGLTVRCAHCHSHKYDPLPQRDYYRLAAVFKGAYDEHDWMPPLHKDKDPGRLLPYIDPDSTPYQLLARAQEREEHNSEIERQIAALKSALESKAEPIKKKILDQRLSKLPKGLEADLREIAGVAPDKRTDVQKYLAQRFEAVLKIEPADLMAADPAYRAAANDTDREIRILEAKLIPEDKIRALWDRGQPSPTYLLRRANSGSFGPLVNPGVPSALSAGIEPYKIVVPWSGARSTGRRLALAKWLVQPNHPLTSRVIVNRIWAQHFGAGIVKSVGNFGHTGTPPTHPELLDWLAVNFAQQGWSMKALHRLVMTSSTYRQSSVVTPELDKADPDARLLSHMRMRRMSAEMLNDSFIEIAGRLDERRYGPPDPVFVRDDGLVDPIEGEHGRRRSIYLQQRRSETPTLFESFDFPQLNPACLERSHSNVATQALGLLNDGMVRKLADGFATRVEKESGDDPGRRIEQAYWIALSRPPSAEEKKTSLESLAELRTAAGAGQADHKALVKFCHMLMNSAAFLYID